MELRPESGPLTCDPGPLAGVGDVLAGESAEYEVDTGAFLSQPPSGGCAYVVVAGDVGPVLRQDPAAPGVDLHLADGADAGTFDAEVEVKGPQYLRRATGR